MRRNATLGLLSFAAGGMDALSFLALGVFTSAMSGNAVLLGISLGEKQLADASRSALAFAGFAAGVALASLAAAWPARRVLFVEAVLLAGFAALWPAEVHVIHSPIALSRDSLPGLTVLAGVAMGMQSAAARRMDAPGINTVVFTSTLTDIVAALVAAIRGRSMRHMESKTWRQIGALLLYIAGAIALGVLGMHKVSVAPLPAFGLVLLAAILA